MKSLAVIVILDICLIPGVWSQVSIQSGVDADQLICPGAQIDYYTSLPSEASLCSISWNIIEGSGYFYNGDDDKPNVIIIWDDQKPNKVEVQASVDYIDSDGSCTSPENAVVTFEHVLRSVFQKTIPNVGSSVEVPYCSGAQPTVTLSVGPMYIKNTGGFDEPPTLKLKLTIGIYLLDGSKNKRGKRV